MVYIEIYSTYNIYNLSTVINLETGENENFLILHML